DRDVEGAEAALDAFELGPAVVPAVVEADATDADAMAAVAADVVERWGTIDVLVCNAGGSGGWRAYASQITREELLGAYELNALTAVASAGAVIPHMRRRRAGKIVTVASLAGVSAYNDGW